ncbi:hypothetical protein [Amycolatopsis plumensis]|uniref:hypothetical protein n=1 Tax=Amycolatopsis plumensis TaxID=236508 RepID=UPI00361629DE
MLTAIAALLGPFSGVLAGLFSARRAVRNARSAGERQALAALHTGYQNLLRERAAYTRDLLDELTSVNRDLAALRRENAELLGEIRALRGNGPERRG